MMPGQNSPKGELAQSRLTQVFKFLKELHELRNPVPRDLGGAEMLRLDTWPSHPCVQVSRGDRENGEAPEEDEGDMEPIIRVERARLTACPKAPESLESWLKPGWQNADSEPAYLDSRNFQTGKQTKTVGFSESKERVEAFDAWATTRKRWAIAERPALAARALFERIHALWTMMQREGDRVELVLADGMLCVSSDAVRHPVLMQRVGLEFDPGKPEFRFHLGTEKVELHRGLLRLIPTIEGRMIAHFDKELEQQPVEPLGGVSTEGFFRRLVQGLFTDGEFLDAKPHGSTPVKPSIWREAVIFLRPRTAGLSTTLDYIVEDLENDARNAPIGLSRIVGVESDDASAEPTVGDCDSFPTPDGPEPDILFSKPANGEQYEIAARLTKARAVLVQGPPGTGKTHTIANLLGFLLSQGKTVLVTAHTTKALRVLRGQVDEALQPLCLSVLEGDADSQAQLSHAAQAIADRLSRSDAGQLRREAGLLREKRQKLRTRADILRRQLRDARYSEVEEIVFGGEAVKPLEVAKRVKDDAERDGWIPGPLQVSAFCPLSDAETRMLYATQNVLTPTDESALSVSQPRLAELVGVADFRQLALQQAGADTRAKAHRPEFWHQDAVREYSAAHLRELHQRVQKSATTLSEEQNWLREVLYAGWSGGDLRESWCDLIGCIQSLVAEAGTAQRLVQAHGPELPEGQSTDEVAAMLSQIFSFLEGGGAFGFKTKLLHRGWHQLKDSCRVNGRVPQTVEEFRSLLALANLEINRKEFAARWRRAVENLDGPSVESLGRFPERTAHGYAAEIQSRLNWRMETWEPLIAELNSAGFKWDSWLASHPPVPGDHGELARVQRAGSHGLVDVVEAQAALLQQSELSAALQAQRTYLAGFPQSDAALVLLQAQASWNVESYEEACRELARLEGLSESFQRRVEMLARLQPVAPSWAHTISRRESPHHDSRPPGDAVAAWRWRQWIQELDRRAGVSMADLQQELEETQNELRQVAAQIIEHETWAAQKERTGLQSQQALMGFVQTIRKVGKGKGDRSRVQSLLQHARELLASARRAVPVWIMPLSRVFESFDPRETKFDVVIIDEASQSDVTALAALYLGNEHVVVGDKEQVTPDAVGQQSSQVQRLIATDLQGVPNSHLYDGQTSIYDLAETAFGGVVALREHFRCVPEIIQFSNHLSYNLTIRPLREPLSASIRPALVAHRVNGYRDERGKANMVEAAEIASLVVACIADSEYARNESGRPTSFGVISLLGDEQALLVENLLRRRISPDILAKHRLLCGNAAQFQGDERDVIFLSMVDGPPEDGQLPYRDAGPKDLYKKRYNVAVSRARNQLWVIHSLDPNAHLKGGDLRRRLIEHARDPQALIRSIEDRAQRTESVFEKLVLQRLASAGYRVQPQWAVGAYRIDLVVEGVRQRLAVECDGERWHTPDQLHQDLERQAILERLGWVFIRIRGSLFFRDPVTAMAPIFAKLELLGIEPLGSETKASREEDSEMVQRIKRAAEQLRATWMAEESVGEEGDP